MKKIEAKISKINLNRARKMIKNVKFSFSDYGIV